MTASCFVPVAAGIGCGVDVLDDIWRPGVGLVVCGTAVGECAVQRGHHYAQRGNGFWRLLHDSGLTPRLLAADEESQLLHHDIGLVDLVKDSTLPYGFDVARLESVLRQAPPRWIAFNGRVGADAVALAVGAPRPLLGVQDWMFAGSRVFVLPSSSGANQRKDHGGRPRRLDWWSELAEAVPAKTRRPDRPPAPALRTPAPPAARPT